MHVGQSEIAAGVTIGETGMVETKEVQNRSVEIVNVDAVLNGAVAKIVGGAMNVATFDAAAGQPNGKTPVVVIAP